VWRIVRAVSYDLFIQPRKAEESPQAIGVVAKAVTDAGALPFGEGRYRLSESMGEVDVDLAVTAKGVVRVEISSSAASASGVYRFAAAVAEALGWDVFDPQGGQWVSLAEVKRAAELADDDDDDPAVGIRTLVAGAFFVSLSFIWLVRGGSQSSVLFPLVIALAVVTIVSAAVDRVGSRGASRRRRTRS
jgi:hypothetical protein